MSFVVWLGYLLTSPKDVLAADFPMLGGAGDRTGFVEESGPKSDKIYWKFTFDDLRAVCSCVMMGEPAGAVVINDGRVLAVTEAGILALDVNTRKKEWLSEPLGGGGIATGEKLVYFTSSAKNKVVALKQSDGKKAWETNTLQAISHSFPLVAEDKVFVGDDSGTLFAFGEETGKEIWRKKLGEGIHSSPTFGDGKVFVGTEGAEAGLLALSPETGEILWRFSIGKAGRPGSERLNYFHATAAFADGKVFIGGENWFFYVVNARDGSLLWKKEFGGWFTAAPALDEKNIYAGNWDGNFYAFSQKDGEIVWKYNLEKDAPFEVTQSPRGEKQKQGPNTWPVVTKERVFLGASNGYFYSFDKATGKPVWKEKYGHAWLALADGVLVIPVRPKEEDLAGDMLVAVSDKSRSSIGQSSASLRGGIFRDPLSLRTMAGIVATVVFFGLAVFLGMYFRRRSKLKKR